jgi:predicted dehydrogenase
MTVVNSSNALNWGVLGTGNIARLFAAALLHSSAGRLAAVASRSPILKDVPEFAGARGYDSYDKLLADRAVDAVYIATPHTTHCEWTIKACEAGKHVLCEKPIALNAAEAERMFTTARRCNVTLMEAFMYRTHPQTEKLVQLIREGSVGKVELIHIEIGFGRTYDPKSRLFDASLGGGAILDIGCYAMSMARLIAGAAAGTRVAEPEQIHASARRAPNGVDAQAYAIVDFPPDITAVISAPLNLVQPRGVRIHGEAGEIHVPSPWLCTGRMGGRSSIVLTPRSGEEVEIPFETTEWLYAIEARAFRDAAIAGEIRAPAPDAADTLGNMRALDTWRECVGIAYPSEQTMPADVSRVTRS